MLQARKGYLHLELGFRVKLQLRPRLPVLTSAALRLSKTWELLKLARVADAPKLPVVLQVLGF